MATEVVLPLLGLTTEKGTIVKWLKSEGDSVRKGDILFELETDKVVTEVESPASGILKKILVPAGVEVPVLTVVAVITEEGEELPVEYLREEPEKVVEQDSMGMPVFEEKTAHLGISGKRRESIRAVPAARRFARDRGIDLSVVQGTGPNNLILLKDVQEQGEAVRAKTPEKEVQQEMAIKASPLARSMASAHGLHLAEVKGTGPRGRITKADIIRALKEKEEGAQIGGPTWAREKTVSSKEILETIPIRGIRKAIFKNMYQSLSQSAQITLHTEACAESLVALRERLRGKDERISYNAILMKITAAALRLHPKINTSVDGDTIHVWRQIHMGLAMEANDALIVPVVRNPDLKTISEINHDIVDLINRTRDNRLSPDDLTNGTFTISNLGFADIDFFTPIIRPPESAILGVGRIVRKPVVKGEAIVPEKRIGLSLTFDHRIIDGTPGARFLKTVKEMIEDPILMIS